MPDTNLASVPPPEIALTEIVRVARNDFVVVKELTFPGPTLGAQVFDAGAKAFGDIVDASTRKAVNGAVFAFAGWCEQFDAQVTQVLQEHVRAMTEAVPETVQPPAQPAGPTRAAVESEIARLKDWVRSMNMQMQPLVDEKTDIEDMRLEVHKKERHASLQSAIDHLAALKVPVEDRVAKLEHYLRSLAIVESGVPGGLDEPLGAIPDASALLQEVGAQERTPEPQEPATATQPAAVPPPLPQDAPELRKQLHALAHVHGLAMPVYALVYSLFDIFDRESRTNGPRNRGYGRLLRTAHDVGILSMYGWKSAEEALHGSSWGKGEHDEYLEYRGNPGGLRSSTFRRTATPLPWDSASLVSAEQRQRFVQILTSPERS